MSFVASPFVVILDANVLFPFRIRDILLTFAHEGLFRARFTDEIPGQLQVQKLTTCILDAIDSISSGIVILAGSVRQRASLMAEKRR